MSMEYRYRYEFEEPDDRGRRRVRAYRGDACVMSGVLVPQAVNVEEPYVCMWMPRDDRPGVTAAPWTDTTDEDGMAAIRALVATVSKWHVFVFIDDCPWVIKGVPGYGTEAEADAFVDGFHYYAGEDTRAIRWPFTAPDLAKVLHDVDADALMVDVLARVASMGLVTT